MKKITFLLLAAAFGYPAAAGSLADVERPDFSVSSEVVASLDSMIGRLEAAAEDGPASWQVGRALGNCKRFDAP